MTGKACSTSKLLCSVLILCLLCTLCFAEEKKEENGILQPVIQYSSIRDPGFDNAVSENMTFCVYVETDHDTDNDGMADLVKVLVQVPRPAVEGKSMIPVAPQANTEWENSELWQGLVRK